VALGLVLALGVVLALLLLLLLSEGHRVCVSCADRLLLLQLRLLLLLILVQMLAMLVLLVLFRVGVALEVVESVLALQTRLHPHGLSIGRGLHLQLVGGGPILAPSQPLQCRGIAPIQQTSLLFLLTGHESLEAARLLQLVVLLLDLQLALLSVLVLVSSSAVALFLVLLRRHHLT